MKMVFQIFCCLGLLIASNVYAQDEAEGQNYSSTEVQEGQDYSSTEAQEGQDYSGTEVPADHPVEGYQQDGWTLWVHYEPRYYTKDCCIDQVYACDKLRCCYEKKYYDVQRCRFVPQYCTDIICRCGKTFELDRCCYVPQYYTESICRREPYYYREPGWKIRKIIVKQDCCDYLQFYYWKCDSEAAASES